MKSKPRMWMAVVMAAALTLAGTAYAQREESGAGPGRGWGGPGGPGRGLRAHRTEMMRGLDLSREQRDKIAELRERRQRAAIRGRADLETASLDLHKLMRAENPDRAAIGRQIDRMAQLRAEMQKGRVNAMLDMRAVLTPDQREKARERMRSD